MKSWLEVLLSVAISVLLVACSEKSAQIPMNKIPPDNTSKLYEEMDKEFVSLENEEIDNYVDSLSLNVKKVFGGVRFIVTEVGDTHPQKGDWVTIVYSIKPLDGDYCEKYKDREATFVVGGSELPQGIEYSVVELGVGNEAEFIIPSYLAYGVSGKGDCISSVTPVIAKIKLVKIGK